MAQEALKIIILEHSATGSTWSTFFSLIYPWANPGCKCWAPLCAGHGACHFFHTLCIPWGGRKLSRLKMNMYAYGWFMLRFDRKQQNSTKQSSFNKKNMNYKKMNKISECENVKKEKLGYRANWVENYFMLFVRENAFMSWHLINTPRTSLMK